MVKDSTEHKHKHKKHHKHRHHRHYSRLYKGMSRENRHIMRNIYRGAGLLFFVFVVVLVCMYINRRKTDEMIAARKTQAIIEEQTLAMQESIGEDDFNKLLSSNEVSYEGKTYLRNTYIKNYLVMGIDKSGGLEHEVVNGSGGQADAIFLVAHDTSKNTIEIVKVPRDTMTPIHMTDLSGNILGVDYQHLTLAFGYGDGREQSCEFMCEAVNRLLCGVKIDGYLAASVDIINKLNDMVGGIDVVIEDEELVKANPAFVKGQTVHLEGEMAERFVRYRDTNVFDSAINRMNRQTQYLVAFEKKFKELSAGDDSFIPKLIEETQPYTITNLDKGTYLRLAMDLAASENITDEDFYTLPGKSFEGTDFDEYHPDEDGIIELMLALFFREKT